MKLGHAIAVSVLLFVMSSCSREPMAMQVGDATYRFPADAGVTLPNVKKRVAGSVVFDVGRDNDGRPSKNGLSLEYNESFNASYKTRPGVTPLRWVSSGLPRVRWLLAAYSSKDSSLFVIQRPWGQVLCDKDSIREGLYLACGSSFNESGADWQVLFHFDKLRQNTDIIAEARQALRRIRVSLSHSETH